MTISPSRIRVRHATFGVARCLLAAVGVATTWSFARTARSFECRALRRGQPYAVADLAHGIACAHVDTNAGSWSLCVPLLAQGTALGFDRVTVAVST
jgi:hypothetical protein